MPPGDRELLAALAQLNTDMPSLALRIMEGRASVAEQVHYGERLMSNVWGTRYRLLCEQLEQWKRNLSGEKQLASEVVEGSLVQLLTAALLLLRQHAVNEQEKCTLSDASRFTLAAPVPISK